MCVCVFWKLRCFPAGIRAHKHNPLAHTCPPHTYNTEMHAILTLSHIHGYNTEMYAILTLSHIHGYNTEMHAILTLSHIHGYNTEMYAILTLSHIIWSFLNTYLHKGGRGGKGGRRLLKERVLWRGMLLEARGSGR